jgi:hypothetical protein
VKPAIVSFAVTILAVSNSVGAQEVSSPQTSGVRHALYVAVKIDPKSPILDHTSNDGLTVSITLQVRISAHFQETDFYGVIPVTISAFDPTKGSDAREIWKDARCHHSRGLPKVTLIAVEGSATNGQNKVPIAARYRRVGRLLPEDEVTASKRLGSGTDNIGPFIATRTETRQSRLLVDMKLYSLPCNLPVGAQ